MADVEMNGLSFQMVADTSQARQAINSLSRTLERLRTAAGGAASSEQQFSGAVRDSSKSVKTQQKEVEETTRKVEILKNSLSRLGSGLGHIGNGFRSLGGAIAAGGSALRGFASFTARITGMKAMGSAISGITGKLHGMFSGLLRIAKFRLFRTIIREITQGFIEGTKNVYAYSQAVGTSFAPAMDRIATSTKYLKNSLGAMAAPLLEALAPALEFIIDKFVDFLNIVNQVIAKLNGKEFTTVAKKVATKWQDATDGTKKSIDKLKKSILGFDELNVLTDNTKNNPTGTAGDNNNAAISFEEIKIDSKIGDVVGEIKSKIENGDWAGAGATLATKLNELFDPKKFTTVGTNLGTIINNGIKFANGFIKTLNAEKIGASLAGFLRGAIKTIDWKLLGETMSLRIWKAIEFLWGLIKNFPAAETAQALSEFVIGAFKTLAQKIGGTDWVEVGKTCNQKLTEFFQNLDWQGIWDSTWSLIAEAFGAAVEFTAGVAEDVWDNLSTWWDEEIVNNPDGESWGKNLWDAVAGWVDGAAGGITKAFVNSSWADDFVDGAAGVLDSVFGEGTGDIAKKYEGNFRKTLNEEGYFAAAKSTMSEQWGDFKQNTGIIAASNMVKINDATGGGLYASLEAAGKFKDWITGIPEWFGTTFTNIKNTVGGFVDKFKTKFNEVKEKIDKAKEWFSLLWEKISYLFKGVASWFKGKFQAALDRIKEVFSPVKDFFKEKWQNIKDFFAPAATWFKDKFSTALTRIKEVFKPITDWFGGIWDSIKKKFNPDDKPIAEWFKEKFADAKKKIKEVFGNIGDWFKTLWEGEDGNGGIKGAFTKIGTNIANAVGGAFKTVVNKIIGSLEGIINGGIKLINKFVGFLNDVTPGKDLAELKEVKFGRLKLGGVIEHDHVHKYASGGIPSHGSVFVAGESGAEMMGNINNRTEVMNRFQIADVMYNSIQSAMKPFTDSVRTKVVQAANAIVSSNLYLADVTANAIETYAPSERQVEDDRKMYEAVRMGVSDATARQNDLLREQNNLLRSLLEKDSTAVVTTDSIISGLSAHNKRVGRQVIPVNA